MSKYGARVLLKGTGVVMVKQTVQSANGGAETYKVDAKTGNHRVRHVALTDNDGIAQAIRDALQGKLREHVS